MSQQWERNSTIARVAKELEDPHSELARKMAEALTDPKFEAHLKRYFSEHSGNDGYCSDDNCKGRIVKQVRGLCSIGYVYDIPHCSKCGRQYRFAGSNVPSVGHKDFEELMNTPFTI